MAEPVASGEIRHGVIAVLGILTICSYGCWYYAFGVLLDPILDDTGWRESTLAASFSAGQVLIGLTSLAGGRLLDRAGHRTVFALGGALTFGGLMLASIAEQSPIFFVGAMVGLGGSGALGFYHVTMPTAVRLNPDGPRAITVLTVWGALASAIFLPATAWLVEAFEWRVTTQILAIAGTSAFAVAALLLPPQKTASGFPRNKSLVYALLSIEGVTRMLTMTSSRTRYGLRQQTQLRQGTTSFGSWMAFDGNCSMGRSS